MPLLEGGKLWEYLEKKFGEKFVEELEEELVKFLDGLSHNFTVVDEFDSGNGKFSDGLGVVALIDCHYVNDILPQIV